MAMLTVDVRSGVDCLASASTYRVDACLANLIVCKCSTKRAISSAPTSSRLSDNGLATHLCPTQINVEVSFPTQTVSSDHQLMYGQSDKLKIENAYVMRILFSLPVHREPFDS